MKIVPASIHSSALGVVSVVLLACALFACMALYLQPKGRVSCADFGSYGDALDAYKHGATQLSKKGASGIDNHIPCEDTLYKARLKSEKK